MGLSISMTFHFNGCMKTNMGDKVQLTFALALFCTDSHAGILDLKE